MNKKNQESRLSILVRKIHTAFLMLLAVPVVLLVRLLKPFVMIRFGRLLSRRIGHFVGNTEIYLCERDAGMHNPRTLDIFYHYLPICNYQVKKMWERAGKLHIFPFSNFMQAVDRLNSLLPDREAHTVLTKDIDSHGLRVRAKPYFSFTSEEDRLGCQELQRLGLPKGAPFICFYARDSAYLDTVFPDYEWRYQDYRDSNINNYILAAKEMVKRGYFMVRMGTVIKEALNTDDPRIIDYAKNGRTDFLDIYLASKSKFFICGSAGISAIFIAFRRPLVLVNFIQLEALTTGGIRDLLIPKKFWLRRERRFMTFQEILSSGIGHFCTTKQYEDFGIEFVENTPEEIRDVASEMDERLNGTWQDSEEDEELQKRFWALRKTGHINPIVLPRIGTEFLRQNRKLLE